MGRSHGFGSTARDSAPSSDSVSLRLRSCDLNLAANSNSPGHSTKGTPSPHPCLPWRGGTDIRLRLLVGTRFQVLFHSPHRGSFHLSLTVLVHYRSPRVFSLTEWSPQIHTGFHGSRVTWVPMPASPLLFVYRTFTFSGATFQTLRLRSGFLTRRPRCRTVHTGPTTPQTHRRQAVSRLWFRLFPFRSPLLRESRSLSPPPATEMFQFAGLPPLRLWIQRRVTRHDPRRVAPFGYLRIIGCLRLPEAFRCWLRPSSALGAKASTVCPYCA